MSRKFSLGLFVLVALSLFSASVSDARPISPNNPYRSFNLSGVNYGSMQWERQHRGMRAMQVHPGLFFRRR